MTDGFSSSGGQAKRSIWLPGVLLAACLLVACLLTACLSTQAEVITITATPSPPPPQDSGDEPPPLTVNPLTGLPINDPAMLLRRPLAAKISNAPAVVRPQAGIAAADLVFEHYTEGSLTRFTAIFWTHVPPRIGSIRSARLIDLEIPAMYGTLLVYSGASEPIRRRIADLPFADRAYEGVTTGAPLYYRDPAIEAPHNLFAVPAEVWQRAAGNGNNTAPDLTGGMVFADTPPPNGGEAAQVVIDYGPDVVRWQYDTSTGQYARFVNDEPHTDANTNEQVTAANVIVIYAHHQPDLSIVESEWQGSKSFSIEIQIWTLGPATLFRDGQVYTGNWMRWEENSMLSFWTDDNATENLLLKPGNTWFQVVPLDFTDISVE
ncbi:MAG: DUF3048 domain-containing protein [Anaerolineae bacterium]|nr:DUF3048 domain-containing protein [Anaerolineae bacterium]